MDSGHCSSWKPADFLQNQRIETNKVANNPLNSSKPTINRPDSSQCSSSKPSTMPHQSTLNDVINLAGDPPTHHGDDPVSHFTPSQGEPNTMESNMGQSLITDCSYAMVTNTEGPWMTMTHKKNKANSSGLRGAKKEKLCQVYVGNIECNEEDNEDRIIHNLKKHASSRGVRIVHARVIYNKYNDYVVSCKVSVTASDRETILARDFWPSDIRCRDWEREKNAQHSTDNYARYDENTETLSRTICNDKSGSEETW